MTKDKDRSVVSKDAKENKGKGKEKAQMASRKMEKRKAVEEEVIDDDDDDDFVQPKIERKATSSSKRTKVIPAPAESVRPGKLVRSAGKVLINNNEI